MSSISERLNNLSSLDTIRRDIEGSENSDDAKRAFAELCGALGIATDSKQAADVVTALKALDWKIDAIAKKSPAQKLGDELARESARAPASFGGAAPGRTLRSLAEHAAPASSHAFVSDAESFATRDVHGIYAKIGIQPQWFSLEGKRFLAPAMFQGEVVGLKLVGPPGTALYHDALGTLWRLETWLIATPAGLPQRYSWHMRQVEPDGTNMPERERYRPLPTPVGGPQRYVAEGKYYIVRAYPLEGGGTYQIAIRTDAKFKPL